MKQDIVSKKIGGFDSRSGSGSSVTSGDEDDEPNDEDWPLMDTKDFESIPLGIDENVPLKNSREEIALSVSEKDIFLPMKVSDTVEDSHPEDEEVTFNHDLFGLIDEDGNLVESSFLGTEVLLFSGTFQEYSSEFSLLSMKTGTCRAPGFSVDGKILKPVMLLGSGKEILEVCSLAFSKMPFVAVSPYVFATMLYREFQYMTKTDSITTFALWLAKKVVEGEVKIHYDAFGSNDLVPFTAFEIAGIPQLLVQDYDVIAGAMQSKKDYHRITPEEFRVMRNV